LADSVTKRPDWLVTWRALGNARGSAIFWRTVRLNDYFQILVLLMPLIKLFVSLDCNHERLLIILNFGFVVAVNKLLFILLNYLFLLNCGSKRKNLN
jgi:hypothetical protein